MAAKYSYNAPIKNTAPDPTGNSSGATKSRIYELEKHTIELDEMSLPAQPGGKDRKLEVVASMEYPFIKINDYIFSPDEIQVMEIDSNTTIPTIMLKCTMVHRTFLSREMPKDGDIISIVIRNKNEILKQIRNDYVITSVISASNATAYEGPVTMTFYGILYIPWISSSKFNFSYEGTSFEAIQDLSSKIGLGFATNEDNTDDKQVWISGYSTSLNYIKNTVLRSWSNNESFYDTWIDIYYNLNFVNVNKQLMSNEEELDPAAWLNNVNKDYTWGDDTKEDKTIETPKVFSNYDVFKTTSFYITSWKPINKSTKITFELGTKINCHMFEHNEKLFQDETSKKYWDYGIEPHYDPDKIDKYILLRGRATQNLDDRKNNLARANYSYPEMYTKNAWLGIQYTISNPEEDNLKWDGNHHKNYIRARVQNVINNKELDKLNLEITTTGLNLNIIKGDKVPVVLIQKNKTEGAIISKESEGMDRLEQFYSGWYYVKGFKIKYVNRDNNAISNFTETFTLTRREWPPPIAVGSIKNNENNLDS